MKSFSNKVFKLADLVKDFEEGDVRLRGDPNCVIEGISPIQQAMPGHLTFLNNSLYRKHLSVTKASAVILTEEEAELCPVNAVITSNPYFVYAKIAAYFNSLPTKTQGTHSKAVLSKEVSIHASASIGPNCVLGHDVKIRARAVIGPGCVIGDSVTIDEDTQLDAHVTIYHGVTIGKHCRIASGVVIGSDGFGFANQGGVWHKVPQLGSVSIGDDVDIGANTTIDRGAVGDTVINKGVKLDNLIQIGHNVEIGENTIMAGCTAVAGSTSIGKNCMVGGATCFAGHIQIADNVMITGMTAVTKSIREAGIYSSGIVGAIPNHEFRKNNARFHRLESLMQRVKKLETEVTHLKGHLPSTQALSLSGVGDGKDDDGEQSDL